MSNTECDRVKCVHNKMCNYLFELFNAQFTNVIDCNSYEEKRPHGEWIPVSKELPEDMQEVLVWFEYYRYGDYNCMYQTYGFCHVFDGKWSSFINGETGWQDARIIAWQPLPEPYKKGGAE